MKGILDGLESFDQNYFRDHELGAIRLVVVMIKSMVPLVQSQGLRLRIGPLLGINALSMIHNGK